MTTSLKSDDVAQLAETFGLLADRTRLSIVVQCRDGGPIAAGDIAAALSLSPSLVSHHLRLLRATRILQAERRGKQVFYALADACVREVLSIMAEHLFSHGHSGREELDEGD